MQNIVTTLGEGAAELDLERMAGEIVNQNTLGTTAFAERSAIFLALRSCIKPNSHHPKASLRLGRKGKQVVYAIYQS
jgi:hypothetical protein